MVLCNERERLHRIYRELTYELDVELDEGRR